MMTLHSTDTTNYVMGDNVDEVVRELLSRIRPQSKEFYEKELKKDLATTGKSLVDRHAIGAMTIVYLDNPATWENVRKVEQ